MHNITECSGCGAKILRGCLVNKINSTPVANYIIEDELCANCMMLDAKSASKNDHKEEDLAKEQELKKLFDCNEKL